MSVNRIKGLLNYKLKGKPGWSSFQPEDIDIADIISVGYNKRLFCLFDRNNHYTLEIKCFNISTEIILAPAITLKGIGLAFVPRNTFESTITRRFKTLDEINKEIDIISNFQTKLDEYALKIRNEIINKE